MDNPILYLILINAAAFAVYGLDKQKARTNSWRIRESTLILLAIMGGSYGAYAAMKIFHHKTRKPLFRFGIPFLMILETAILVFTLYQAGPSA